MDPITIGITVASLIVTYLLHAKTSSREPAREEKFEVSRVEEGAPIPVVIGAGEIAPNLAWYGNILNKNSEGTIKRIDAERLGDWLPKNSTYHYLPPWEGWYADMFGVVCHGTVTELVDLKFGDWWLSRCRRRSISSSGVLVQNLSIAPPWPNTGSHLEVMTYCPEWWGKEQRGITGLIHFHYGEQTDVVCEFSKTWFGEENASAFPGVAYITFGWGYRSAAFDRKANARGWADSKNWIVSVSPYDRVAYPWRSGNPLYNPLFTSPAWDITDGFGDSSTYNAMMGVFFYPNGLASTVPGEEDFNFLNVGTWRTPMAFAPPVGTAFYETEDGVEVRENTDQQVTDRAPGQDSIIFSNCSLVCFGCQDGHNLAFMPIQGLQPDLQVRVRFKYARCVDFYGIRSPRSDICGDPGGPVESGAEWNSCVGFAREPNGTDFGAGSQTVSFEDWANDNPGDQWEENSICFKVGVVREFDHTFTMPNAASGFWTPPLPYTDAELFPDGATAFNLATHFLVLGYDALSWRDAWWATQIWDLEVSAFPEQTDAPYHGVEPIFNNDGVFYWGTSATPPSPLCIVRVIPTGVSGAGISDGANPADAIYEILTNTQWGMGLAAGLIDMASFQAAADTLVDEQFPISLVLTNPQEAEETLDDILGTIDAVLFSHPNTGLMTLKLLRPDYSVSALPDFGPSDMSEFTMNRPDVGDLLNEVRVTFRRYRSGSEDGVITNETLVPPPYNHYAIMGTRNTNISDLVLMQGATTIPTDEYTWTRSGVIHLLGGPTIDYDGPTGLSATYMADPEPPGFEDASVTATSQAAWTMLGEIRSDTVTMPMVMDAVTAQRVAERVLLSVSRPLRRFRGRMRRAGTTVLPGAVLSFTWPDLGVDAVPSRIIGVDYGTIDAESVEFEAIEDKWGTQEHLLIFEPAGPPRPPLDFPSGDAATPASSLVQLSPSWVRLKIQGEVGTYEIMRNNFRGTYLNNPSTLGGYNSGDQALSTTFTVTTTSLSYVFDDPDPPSNGNDSWYYYARRIQFGKSPSIWIGPVYAVYGVGTPPDEADPTAPTVDYTAVEDWVVTQAGYVLIRVDDIQHRAAFLEYETYVGATGWSQAVRADFYDPPVMITDYHSGVDYILKAWYDANLPTQDTSFYLIQVPLSGVVNTADSVSRVRVRFGYRWAEEDFPRVELLEWTVTFGSDLVQVTNDTGEVLYVSDPPNEPGPLVVSSTNSYTGQSYLAVTDDDADIVVDDFGSVVSGDV